jgi:hypothetical protein
MSQLNVGKLNASSGVQLPSYTTANLPTTGITAGFMAYDSSEAVVKYWNGSKWLRIGESNVEAYGGETYDWGNYRIHRFTGSGSFRVAAAPTGTTFDVLMVGGGGGGGSATSNCSQGGGGAGGLIYRAGQTISAGSYPVVIGAGGAAMATGTITKTANGGDTTFLGLTALGGGQGGGGGGSDGGRGNAGGSGGGGTQPYSGPVAAATQPTSGSGGFGNAGGGASNSGPEWGGGGGGGAGGQGASGTANIGGNGGNGLAYDVAGPLLYYAGGGAGANCGNPVCTWVQGGLGGGGDAWCRAANNGGDGFGGGGGGGGYSGGQQAAGRGGNGVVIVRYLKSTIDATIGLSSANPAFSAQQILAANPTAASGLYWIKPTGYTGSAQQIYCDMTNDGGGWMLVASSNASDTTIPGGTGRNTSTYYLNRSGSLGTPNPNNDYIIGDIINPLIFQEAKVIGFGRGTTNGSTSFTSRGTWISVQWTLNQTGSSRLIEVRPRSVVSIGGNSSLSSGAAFFVLDGVQRDFVADGSFNANASQSTLGGVGVTGSTGDPNSGCYLGHGAAEGSFEGWYDGSNSALDCQGYTTWVR